MTGSRRQVVIIIPARGGSKGIPRKNLARVGGASLVGRAVLLARRFVACHPELDARIVLDTDDDEIAQEGAHWGVTSKYRRPAELARDATTTLASVTHLLNTEAAEFGMPDSMILLQPTSPLRTIDDLEECWRAHTNLSAESVVSVSASTKPPQLAMRLTPTGTLEWLGAPPVPNARRQDLAASCYPNGSVYVIAIATLLREQAFVIAGATVGIATPAETSIDVDTPLDLLIARTLDARLTQQSPPMRVAPNVDLLPAVASEWGSPVQGPWSVDQLSDAVRSGASPAITLVDVRGVNDASPSLALWRAVMGGLIVAVHSGTEASMTVAAAADATLWVP